MTPNDTYPPREAKKLIPGSELHLTMLMAPDHLNLVVGENRAALLRFAQRVWDAAIAADRAERGEAEQVCAEAYQVVGSLLSDVGAFDTPQAEKVLDNLSQQRMVHADVLPWPSFAPPSHAGDEALLRQCLEALDYAADVINNGCRSTDAAMEAVSGANLAIAALRERLAKEG